MKLIRKSYTVVLTLILLTFLGDVLFIGASKDWDNVFLNQITYIDDPVPDYDMTSTTTEVIETSATSGTYTYSGEYMPATLPTAVPSPTPVPSVFETTHNFLLIGIDSRNPDYSNGGKGSRADVIMVASVNEIEQTIKFISIARDSYAVYGRHTGKINAAMTYGGGSMLQECVQNMLGIDLEGYAIVNFYHMADIIDAVGGVDVNVSKRELNSRYGLNDHLRAVYGSSAPLLHETGDVHLNGKQAVAYARIRYIDSDYKRSERQIEVLRSLLSRFSALKSYEKLPVVSEVCSHIVTNISRDEINRYFLLFLPLVREPSLQYMQLPIKNCFNSGTYGGEWSIRPNWNGMRPYVQQFFYGQTFDVAPAPSIPREPSNCPTHYSVDELLK